MLLLLRFKSKVLFKRIKISRRKFATAPGDKTFGNFIKPFRWKDSIWFFVMIYFVESSFFISVADGISMQGNGGSSTNSLESGCLVLSANVTYQSHQAWLSCFHAWFKPVSKSLSPVKILFDLYGFMIILVLILQTLTTTTVS